MQSYPSCKMILYVSAGERGLKKDHEVILSLLGGATKGKDITHESMYWILIDLFYYKQK